MGDLEDMKDNNVFSDQDSFYTEIASFSSGNDRVRFNYDNSSYTNNVNRNCCGIKENFYTMRIKLFGNISFMNSVCNELLLDGTSGNYVYVDNTAYLDNKTFNPNLYLNNILTGIYASDKDRLVELSMSKTLGSSNCNHDDSKIQCTGFKLSEIMSSIGDLSTLSDFSHEFSADICVEQDVCFINKCFGRYVVFNFKLYNTGCGISQNLLFKDIFPSDIHLDKRGIFIDGNRVCDDRVDISNNKVLIKLPNLGCKEGLNITIVGCTFLRSSGINFATISYVSKVFKCLNGFDINISQKISNTKIL